MSDTVLYQAVKIALDAHKNQKRASGESFIIRPLFVVEKLTFIGNVDLLVIAMLHDVLENSMYTYKQLKKEFGETTANCVKFLTKDHYPTKMERAEKYMKKLEKGCQYSNSVYLVKLVDILHNAETLNYFPSYKQKIQAIEILNFYMPWLKKNLSGLKEKYQLFAYHKINIIQNTCESIMKQEEKMYVKA